MAICKKKIFIYTFLKLFLTFILINPTYAEVTFKDLKDKKVSYLDFFLLKFENRLATRAYVLGKQSIPTRVQYSRVGSQVDYDNKEDKIFIKIYAVMDKSRYSKKKYRQKLSDCNQIRNLIFYRKHGYKFFTQKRDPALSEEVMVEIFKEVFFENISFDENEIKFLLDKMFINVTIFHPVKKTELTCAGRVNDYVLE